MADEVKPPPVLPVVLIVLTVVSGFIDAVSYLGLGHVFTANMTGNVVLLGLGAAGASGFSVAASTTSLVCFLAGAVCAGRLCLALASRRHWLIVAMVMEGTFAAAAAVVSASTGGVIGSGWARYTVIALLAFAMGVRNSTLHRLAVPAVATTVLTTTLTGLAADSSLAGGDNEGVSRKVAAVAAMLAGAFAGALLFLHQGATWPLAVVAVTVLATTAVFARDPRSRQLDHVA